MLVVFVFFGYSMLFCPVWDWPPAGATNESIRRAADTPYHVRAAANTLAQKLSAVSGTGIPRRDGEQQLPERIPAAEPGWDWDGARWPFWLRVFP